MTVIQLEDTDAGAVESAIRSERRGLGDLIPGMALTLVVVTDEEHQAEALSAANYSAGKHPCRILVMIPRPGRGRARLDAQVSIGEPGDPAENVVLRLSGALASHGASVILPLLLPDTPVVAWWPADSPECPAEDEIGRLAERRITDAAEAARPAEALRQRAVSYHPGDTDLSWTRATGWRSLLASCLDGPFAQITEAAVSSQPSSPTGTALAAWLRARLGVPVTLRKSRGPGITKVSISTEAGEISISRPDGCTATLRRPGQLNRAVPLRIRRLRDVLTEEIHRLGADEVYEEMLRFLDAPPDQVASGEHADEPSAEGSSGGA